MKGILKNGSGLGTSVSWLGFGLKIKRSNDEPVFDRKKFVSLTELLSLQVETVPH